MTASQEPLFSVPELAAAFAVTPRALRFYESKGLLSPRRVGNRRVYDRRDRGRLQLILRGKRLGFSLAEIREYLELYDADAGQTRQIKRLEKLLTARISDLQRQRTALEITLTELAQIRDQVSEEMRKRGLETINPKTITGVRTKSSSGQAEDAGSSGDPS